MPSSRKTISTCSGSFRTSSATPTETTYDANLSGGGAIVQNRLWVNGTIRRWIVDKRVNARNPPPPRGDGQQALDDNTLKNYSGKAVASISTNQKLMFSYLWNDKIRGHRRDGSLRQPDIASVVQTNPASNTPFRLSGSYRLPWELNLAGSMLSNTGYPEVSTYQVTTAFAATQGITLTRSQTVPLTARGEERRPTVTMVDLRLSRAFSFAGGRRVVPQIDFFNIGNASTVVNRTVALGAAYLAPVEILAPRIIRVGFSLDF